MEELTLTLREVKTAIFDAAIKLNQTDFWEISELTEVTEERSLAHDLKKFAAKLINKNYEDIDLSDLNYFLLLYCNAFRAYDFKIEIKTHYYFLHTFGLLFFYYKQDKIYLIYRVYENPDLEVIKDIEITTQDISTTTLSDAVDWKLFSTLQEKLTEFLESHPENGKMVLKQYLKNKK